MLIREGSDEIEIEVVDRAPFRGDVEFSVDVSSSGYTGRGFAWVDGTQLADFITHLAALEEHRQGSAQLESMSKGEFVLRVASVDRKGHMAVSGQISAYKYQSEARPYRHAVEFGFEFDPTALPAVLAAFKIMVASGGSTALGDA
jgi:hypothetical protein